MSNIFNKKYATYLITVLYKKKNTEIIKCYKINYIVYIEHNYLLILFYLYDY